MPYYGGKQRIADRIVSFFPTHSHYVEPYCGSLSVLLEKPASKLETVNDLDQHLVTFWRVLRDRTDDLLRVCELTPHARAERTLAQQPLPGDLDEVEVARRVWVQLTQGRSGIRRPTGWRFYLNPASTCSSMAGYLDGYRGRIPPAAWRLRDVQLECRDALRVVDDYGRLPDTLLYVDPPYTTDVRAGGQYRHEVERDHHEQLLDLLEGCRAQVVLSGYDNALYRRRLGSWWREAIPATTQQGGRPGTQARVEVLWMNFVPADTLFPAGW